MNIIAANEIGSDLFMRGYRPMEDLTTAHFIVVNTCVRVLSRGGAGSALMGILG